MAKPDEIYKGQFQEWDMAAAPYKLRMEDVGIYRSHVGRAQSQARTHQYLRECTIFVQDLGLALNSILFRIQMESHFK